MGQWDVVAEKYSGGYILFCTERQVGAVIVVFLMSASQVYFVYVWHLLCDGGHVLRIGRHFYVFFQSVDIILGVCVSFIRTTMKVQLDTKIAIQI